MVLAKHILEWISLAALAGLVSVALGFLVLPILFFVQRRSPPPLIAMSADPPAVLVQLPVFNEPQLVADLLDSVAALDWPKERLHIQLLDDSSDETSTIAKAKLQALQEAGFAVSHLQRHHRAGFKAEALAAGLAQSDAPLVALLDADFRPPSDWLRRVTPRLLADPGAAFVQSRCEFANANRNWLTRAQGLLFDAHFVLEHGVRAKAGHFIQFNGTAAVWRRAAIEAAGGWCGDSLSEDLNLTLRAALAGWRGLYAPDAPVRGLVPHEFKSWRVQQRRWSMGFAQNAPDATARIWSSAWTLGAKVSASFMLLYQLVALPLVVLAVATALLAVGLGGPDLPYVWPAWVLTAALVPPFAVVMTLPPYLELRRGALGRYFASLAAIPPLVVFLAFANANAILAGFFGRAAHFHRTPKGGWERAEPATPQAVGDA